MVGHGWWNYRENRESQGQQRNCVSFHCDPSCFEVSIRVCCLDIENKAFLRLVSIEGSSSPTRFSYRRPGHRWSLHTSSYSYRCAYNVRPDAAFPCAEG